MKSGLLFSRFFIALVGTIDFQTIGIKLSLKITNRSVEKTCSAFLLSHLRSCLCEPSGVTFSSRTTCTHFRTLQDLGMRSALGMSNPSNALLVQLGNTVPPGTRGSFRGFLRLFVRGMEGTRVTNTCNRVRPAIDCIFPDPIQDVDHELLADGVVSAPRTARTSST